MIRDVFYYNNKPNAHPRERHADSLAHARELSRTEHFWIINEYCDYRNLDWDWDFDFLPDGDVWAENHNNVWPSEHQKDSGTWLCPKEHSEVIIYRADVDPIVRRNEKNEQWVILHPIDESSFDFSWHPDPTDPPYIYVFGNQWHSSITEPTVEYRVPGATCHKYLEQTAICTPSIYNWETVIYGVQFDYSWRPDPASPPYIYVFGNQWHDATTEPTVRYHVPDAVEYSYVSDPIAMVKPDMSLWEVPVDTSVSVDYSWRPHPHDPPRIYQWLNNGPRYVVPGATEVAYMENMAVTTLSIPTHALPRYPIRTTLHDLIIQHQAECFWAVNPDLNYDSFDFTWRPAIDLDRYVSVFGQHYSPEDEGRIAIQTYLVNAPTYMLGHREFNYVSDADKVNADLSMFWIDCGNPGSTEQFTKLKQQHPKLQKTRYLTSWVDTISRCVTKTDTKLFWVLSSEIDYADFTFDYYPNAWQTKMVHVFGTQWSHWGNTYLVNSESFVNDTKYVRIIEHLNMLNFVKTKRAKATVVLHDIVMIDHGNTYSFPHQINLTVPHDTDYLTTFKNITDQLPIKSEHHVWICSSVCDYSSFDFTYICDPFAKDQLHVFPSNRQKFGDTFLVDVNKLRTMLDSMNTLADYVKINFNEHQRVKRLPAPVIQVADDTLCAAVNTEFNFPYAVFQTEEISAEHEQINLWSADTKTIIVTSTGGTRIVVPREAKAYVKKELYDYPYIMRTSTMVHSHLQDIVFLSNGETGADENYEHLLKVTRHLRNRVVRVDGVTGRVAAYHAAANASNTPWAFTVFAKLRVSESFDWSWQPDRLQIPKHYIFQATNPVNGLTYGHQAAIAYNKKLVLANTGQGLDFTLDDEHEVVEMNSGVAKYNTDAWSTWRTAFREVIKLCASDSVESKTRLNIWLTVANGDFAQYSLDGARHAQEYFNEVDGDIYELKLSYDWAWLRGCFDRLYPAFIP